MDPNHAEQREREDKPPSGPPPASDAAPFSGPGLQALLPEEIALRCDIDVSDARRIVSLIHRRGELPPKAPATIRRAALDAVRALGSVGSIETVERLESAVDPFVKYAFRLAGGAVIETVRIPLERPGRYSVCVSSQVGCALACAFCATGMMGLVRNLEAWEIVEQVRIVRRDLAAEGRAPRVHGVLFQGMGEPLANVDRVIQAIRVLSEPSAQAIDMRNITVCTAGLPAGIRRLLHEVPAVRIGLSLGSVLPGRRASLMPIERAHPLEEVLEAVGEHARATGRSPMWAFTLLEGRNDTPDDARALSDLARSFGEKHGKFPRISLIPYNAAPGLPFARSARMEAFRDALHARGIGSILRYSGGGDVGAACGQLSRAEGSRRRLSP
ncbi:MAG: radical SAM protein [Polyangiaceae bacterium]|nr:radical SAM protein [Polyangiaceae bacterium]